MKTIRMKMALALLLPAVVLVPVAMVILAATNTTRDATRAATRSADILRAANLLVLGAVDAETGVRGYALAGDEQFLQPWDEGRESFDAQARTLDGLITDPLQRERVDAIVEAEERWRGFAQQLLDTRRDQGAEAAAALAATGQGKAIKDELRREGTDLLVRVREALDRHEARIDDASDRAALASLLGPLAVVALLLALAVLLARDISGRVRAVAARADSLQAGDLSSRVAVGGNDEVTRLAESFNVMADRLEETAAAEERRRVALETAVDRCASFSARVASGDLTARVDLNGDGGGVSDSEFGRLTENLNAMAGDLGGISRLVRNRAGDIGREASGVLAAVSQHAAAASQQSAAVAEIAATVAEVRLTAEQTAARAQEVATVANSSVRVSDEGLASVRLIETSMGEIRTTVEALANDIVHLSEQAQQINEIIETVADLADQSNLLALNASIEAAKAGEQGKGFAVVAAEVRNLADQSKEATAAVRSILGEIQRATNAAVLATESGTRAVESGSGLAERAGAVIEELAGVVHQAAQAVQVIAVSAHEQSVGMDQIAQSMSEIRDTTSQYAEGSNVLQRSAGSLDAVASELRELVSRYQVEV